MTTSKLLTFILYVGDRFALKVPLQPANEIIAAMESECNPDYVLLRSVIRLSLYVPLQWHSDSLIKRSLKFRAVLTMDRATASNL